MSSLHTLHFTSTQDIVESDTTALVSTIKQVFDISRTLTTTHARTLVSHMMSEYMLPCCHILGHELGVCLPIPEDLFSRRKCVTFSRNCCISADVGQIVMSAGIDADIEKIEMHNLKGNLPLQFLDFVSGFFLDSLDLRLQFRNLALEAFDLRRLVAALGVAGFEHLVVLDTAPCSVLAICVASNCSGNRDAGMHTNSGRL